MAKTADPSTHRQLERRFIDHVERLLSDDRLRVDTIAGRKPVSLLRRDVRREDQEVALTRLMGDLGIYDRELRSQMPSGRELSVNLLRSRFLIFRQVVGRIKAICLSPQKELLEGSAPRVIGAAELKDLIDERFNGEPSWNVPVTVAVMSTSGFDEACRQMVQRNPSRTIVLIEPNEAGGWTVHGPPEAQALSELFDPELDADKRDRIHQTIDRHKADVLHGGLGAERVASMTRLPLRMVEDVMAEYAREAAGLVSRRLEGKMVLFREGSVSDSLARSGGSDMPFLQRVRSLFSRKGDNEKKISVLSERRATLTMQRDHSYEEMGVLEQKEADLRQQFKDTASSITKRRITSQLVQLRKDLERRQQLLGMLNQQINVVGTHLHNLELVQQGQTAALPSSEDLAQDAAAAEEVLAELQASNELAGSVAEATPSGMTAEEQALYEELERESKSGAASPFEVEPAAGGAPVSLPSVTMPPERDLNEPPPLPSRPERRRGEAEPG